MSNNWKHIPSEAAYNQFGLICVKPNTIVYFRNDCDTLETIAFSDEIGKWCYNCVKGNNQSELLLEGFGDTPEKAYENKTEC